MNTLLQNLVEILINTGIDDSIANAIGIFVGLSSIAIISWIVLLIVRKILLVAITRIAKKTSTHWDDILVQNHFFHRLAHIAPAIVIHSLIPVVLSSESTESVVKFIQSGVYIYLTVMLLLAADALINASHNIYLTTPFSSNRPIKGYVQVVKIILYFIAIILILSIILQKQPKTLLTGLGAMAAVLILVFKDTILGLVASIQLSANNMLKIGDWIEMPSHKADGDVLEITLNTVKVQNWDKTISTIPTYALVSESFNNWRGMEESGGRRIKRHINIDMKSVKFCTHEMLEKYTKFVLLRDYIEERQEEIEEYNKEKGVDETSVINGRRQTNLGIFRKYIEMYLHAHPKIHKEMTFLVRQLQPTDKGIPMEIYVFSNDQKWANYEAIQADIFDHILAVIPEFELSVFQSPSGEDFRMLKN